MLGNPGIYANKKRKKPVLKQKKIPDTSEVVKSNPSKRHRDRLNGELDRLMDLLPFPEDIRSRLDKLSVLRLSVGYLRVKSYFKATMKNGSSSRLSLGMTGQNGNSMDTTGFSEGDLLLQALSGFVMVVTSEGLVFYASPTVKDYLGFHQSDVVHQSVFDLIHTDDRALFREQLHFALNPPSDGEFPNTCDETLMCNPEQLPPENSSFLERNFVCRFRCLLDNSSGFLALKFEGRLKYLHGQNVSRDNGNQPQLALFALAVPVQPPSIVEIRAKMLLFQTKHKLDFTPMGVDSRGKIILGYSEIELCMKGSGYQFIHAADMMYVADNHIRMIKTGESGLTVFRLLSKSGSWIWVKSNAKLIYKGGRPEFIIAYQRALTNAEGEEYQRQRGLQLPFICSSGEGILYDSGPIVDITQFQFNQMFNNKDTKKDTAPTSLVDCFLAQDQTVYMQTVDSPIAVDQVFMDSRALISFAGDSWQEDEAAATAGEPVMMKEETKKSMSVVINSLEKLTQNGDFEAVLDHLEVDDLVLTEWENAIKRFNNGEDHQRSADLDSIDPNDIFDYIDSVFKEKGEDCLNVAPSCLGVNNLPPNLCEPQLLQDVNPGPYAQQQVPPNGAAIQGVEPAQMASRNQKLFHQGPADQGGLPPLQQLQLQDIFSPSIELPELSVPNISDTFAAVQSCQQNSYGHVQQLNHLLQPSELAGSGQLLQSSAQTPHATAAPAVPNILPPLIPSSDFTSSSTNTIPARFQDNLPFETHNGPMQQWPHARVLQNGPEVVPAFQGQTQNRAFPCGEFWQRNVTRLNHTEQGGLAGGPAAAQSSCMFQQHAVPPHPGPSGLCRADAPLQQSPPQGSGYFEWSHSELVVGTSVREGTSISPPTATPSMASTEHAHNIQHYLGSNAHTQSNGPALDMSMYLME
ncbi:aryl hydrocarbon receptor 2 [Melanotaenia boesemani]|uniref:aryl hydrocarbon receptor 2 n=1 Tax=Melanotaenia boesemani TaxID=1250792 RepID=UPI001C0578D0|nr:aryl hydrocarbon receptor 2 [Melanotaenia boesemani]